MADLKRTACYKYKVEMKYINNVKHKTSDIPNECVKSIIIDHNFEDNCMPVLYANLQLDKSLVDDMIVNTNDNLVLIAIYKYDDIADMKHEIEIIRDKFIYFLPDDVNKTPSADYNDVNIDETLGTTYRPITLGLMSADMINRNKRHIELTANNNTIFDCVKYITSEFKNMIIEPFSVNDVFDRIIIPAQDSVNAALKFLNSYRVFYYSPYRFYQDFNFTYIISSSGMAIPRNDESFSNVYVNIEDVDINTADDEGIVENKTTGSYEVPVSYADATVYNNSVSNKSRNKIRGISSSGAVEKTLQTSSSYSNDRIKTVRLNNDNDNMIFNLEAEANNNDVFIFFTKNDLDMDVFTINKRITVSNIPRYKENDGTYLLSRKREMLVRESDSFILSTMINLKKCAYSSTVHIQPFNFSIKEKE